MIILFLSIVLLGALYMYAVMKEDERRSKELLEEEIKSREYRRKKGWTIW